jgi:hypothetical protein
MPLCMPGLVRGGLMTAGLVGGGLVTAGLKPIPSLPHSEVGKGSIVLID